MTRDRRGAAICKTALFLCCAVAVTSLRAEGYDEHHPFTLAPSETGLVVSAFAIYDDNVTRTDSDILSDKSLGLSVSDGLAVPFTPYLRALLDTAASVEHFGQWVGLSHADLSGRAQLQFRPSAAFYAPTFAVSARITGLAYDTSLRSGQRTVADFSVLEPVTDRVFAFVAVTHEERRAENSTFDGRSDGVRLHLDDALDDKSTLYIALEHRYGDAVTTSLPDPDNRYLALARTPDPAFGDTGRITYRIKGATNFMTMGLNRVIGAGQSLDLSWRKAALKPARALDYYGATEAKYTDNQIALTYLVQF
jgi:hypothetical protein